MKYLKQIFRPLQNESGQVVVITVFALAFFGLMGALSVDVGIYVNDRRDAQNVVDKAALAGALELTLASGNAATAAATANATAKANEWAENNGIDLSDPNVTLTVNVVNTCYSPNDPVPTGVEVSIQREAASVFLGFVPGVTDWDVNATALACAGRPNEAFGFIPFAVSQNGPCFSGGQPRAGERCIINSAQTSSGSNGQLGFPSGATSCTGGNSSANVLRGYVANGVSVTCAIGDEVQANQGSNVGPIGQGLSTRLSADGACQAQYVAGGGDNPSLTTATNALNAHINPSPALAGPVTVSNARDDFYEIWQYNNDPDSPAEGLQAIDCDPNTAGQQSSPRNVQMIVVNNWASPDGTANNTYVVRGFARAYLEGCEQNGTFYPNCNMGTGQPFNIYVRFVEQLATNNVNLGLNAQFGDIGVFLAR